MPRKNLRWVPLGTGRDWHMKVDLGRQLRLPGTITDTSLRPDMVLFSDTSKPAAALELTVSLEERMEEKGKNMQN